MEQATVDFQHYVAQELAKYRGERIHSFLYAGERYWLKQPECAKGIERWLKPNPKGAFQKELKQLQYLNEQGAPVAELVLWGEDFFVLKDVGISASSYIEHREQTEEFINAMLQKCGETLANLHRQNLIHGRPALRDMVYKNGEIHFVDFENAQNVKNLAWQKVRDSLLYLHSLGRAEHLSAEQMHKAIKNYQKACEPKVWQDILHWVNKYRPIYQFLCLFKKIARTDLRAIYHLFEQLTPFIEEGKKQEKK